MNKARAEKLRRELPYGKWTCVDGREVQYNRSYQPIWQRVDGVVSRADSKEWVREIVNHEWFFNDYSAPWVAKPRVVNKQSLAACRALLESWGVGDVEGTA